MSELLELYAYILKNLSIKDELIKDIVESLIGMIISGSVSIVTGKFALTGKWIVKKE